MLKRLRQSSSLPHLCQNYVPFSWEFVFLPKVASGKAPWAVTRQEPDANRRPFPWFRLHWCLPVCATIMVFPSQNCAFSLETSRPLSACCDLFSAHISRCSLESVAAQVKIPRQLPTALSKIQTQHLDLHLLFQHDPTLPLSPLSTLSDPPFVPAAANPIPTVGTSMFPCAYHFSLWYFSCSLIYLAAMFSPPTPSPSLQKLNSVRADIILLFAISPVPKDLAFMRYPINNCFIINKYILIRHQQNTITCVPF